MKKNKRVSQKKVIINKKQPKLMHDPNSFYDQTPVWSFLRCDFEHDSWGICKCTEKIENLLKRLKSFEGQTWREILIDTSGRKSNTKNHSIETYRICKEAQDRLSAINLEEFDTLYSLTITGKERLWGIMSNGVFCVVWFDKNHEIYEVKKSHT